jgi:hypothetical protein
MGATEIRKPCEHYSRVGDRLLKRCEIDAWIAGRVMCDGRQRVAIGLRNVLSRDSATWTAATASHLHWPSKLGVTTLAPIDVRPWAPRNSRRGGGEFEDLRQPFKKAA